MATITRLDASTDFSQLRYLLAQKIPLGFIGSMTVKSGDTSANIVMGREEAFIGNSRIKKIDEEVEKICAGVLIDDDKAVIEYSNQFDGLQVTNVEQLQVSPERIAQALKAISIEQKQSLQIAADRIRRYHEQQLLKQPNEEWRYTEADGTVLGQNVRPIERVGIYVPGGKASYPSTVLMTAIPAKVACVKEIIICVPTPKGVVNDMVLAAAAIAGVDIIYTIGGAQAIAAMAYGTKSIKKVDKIVGPGNAYVASAKRKVSSVVAVDMEAGPSEILIICDGKTDPEWIALDLLSQAEHDEMARCILISIDKDKTFLDAVEKSINQILEKLERKDIAKAALEYRQGSGSAFIEVTSLEQAAEISNRIAPEHLELAVEDPQALLPLIKHAGAIFLGKYTSEALGDYVAGPSHVLPTSGTARFSSPLGVYDFQKRTSIIQCSPESAATLGKVASVLARSESLTAHARSAEARIKK